MQWTDVGLLGNSIEEDGNVRSGGLVNIVMNVLFP